MVKTKLLLKVLTGLLILFNVNCINAQNVNIPDENFKNALLAHGITITGSNISKIDINNDGEISVSEAQAYTGTLGLYAKGITNLTGIEAFTNLTVLSCTNNLLTSLDVSANTALIRLYCGNNQLTSLDVNANTALTILSCSDNSFTNLDVSANTELTTLYCDNNQLTSLDVSTNNKLRTLSFRSNQLTSVNIANGNNFDITTIDARNNPNLTCIQIDGNIIGRTPSGWEKDATASYNANCGSASTCTNIVNIPDTNFKNALLAHGATTIVNGVDPITGGNISVIDTDGNGEVCVNEAQAYTGTISVHSQSITDLTGIEAFTNLTKLICNINSLTSLDVSANTALTQLACSNNQLTSLDVSANTALTQLYCTSNKLTSLDISTNTTLTDLKCDYNQLTSLNTGANKVLKELGCSSNQLSSLDVSANTILTRLSCNGNTLTSLDISTNTALTYLSCDNNQLTSLDTSANTALRELYCGNNQLTSLNIANGNNANMNPMWAYSNPNLTCIQTDAGIVGTTPNGWQKDSGASYNENCGTASIGELSLNNSIKTYPNPVGSTLEIKTNIDTIKYIEIYNTLGKKVLKTTDLSINMSGLAKGVYIVKMQSSEGKLAIKKIIKK